MTYELLLAPFGKGVILANKITFLILENMYSHSVKNFHSFANKFAPEGSKTLPFKLGEEHKVCIVEKALTDLAKKKRKGTYSMANKTKKERKVTYRSIWLIF